MPVDAPDDQMIDFQRADTGVLDAQTANGKSADREGPHSYGTECDGPYGRGGPRLRARKALHQEFEDRRRWPPPPHTGTAFQK